LRRAAFVSVESHGNVRAVVDALGANWRAGLLRAILGMPSTGGARPARAAHAAVDNMESILLPPYMAEETPEALTAEAREELKSILALCGRLLKAGETRLVFTSEARPPFGRSHRRDLPADREDAVSS
jgi:hypothetical protein